eukprot:4911146-Amphidinium_carterae.1
MGEFKELRTLLGNTPRPPRSLTSSHEVTQGMNKCLPTYELSLRERVPMVCGGLVYGHEKAGSLTN